MSDSTLWGGRETQLVIHYFSPRDVHGRHVHLNGDLALIRAYVSLAGLAEDVLFIQSQVPEAPSLGTLPAGFFDSQLVQTRGLIRRLQRVQPRQAEPLHDLRAARQEASAALAEACLSRALRYTLWVHNPCFWYYTWPAACRGGLRLYASWYCLTEKRKAVQALGGSLDDILSDLVHCLRLLDGQIAGVGQGPSHILEATVFAYLQALLAIPDELTVWGCESKLRKDNENCVEASRLLEKHRNFVQEFGDFLDQVKINRQADVATLKLLGHQTDSHSGPSKVKSKNDDEDDEEDSTTKQVRRHRNNLLMLSWVAVSVTGFCWLKFRRRGD